MIIGALQTAERLAEDEVTDEIEGGIVVPSLYIEGFLLDSRTAVTRFLVQLLQQQINVAHDERLLLAHCKRI